MLCRTANDLYWVARHMERAENTARLLDVTQRIAMLPERLDRGKAQAAPWRRALEALGVADRFESCHDRIDGETVVDFLLLSPHNPSSIHHAFHAARENARAQRVAITAEMYEDLNATWLEMRGIDAARIRNEGISGVLEWIKNCSASFRGVMIGTLGRDEGYHFLRLGTFIERADWAIRMLDVVGSDADLAESREVRDAVEYFQWSALLQSLSAFETYRRLYRDSVNPLTVTELMLLNGGNPRSLRTCVGRLHEVLQSLAGHDGLEVVRQAGSLAAQVQYARLDEIVESGLEAWLQDAMARLVRLGDEIHRQFMSADDEVTPVPAWPRGASQTQSQSGPRP